MSNLQRLRDNVSAIEYALTGKGDAEVLNKYTGFGGLGFILNPIENQSKWNKTDAACYEDTVKLHEILKANSSDERQYKKWVASLKQSTLTAFYTPEELVNKIMDVFSDEALVRCIHHNFAFRRFLDPAAGQGRCRDYRECRHLRREETARGAGGVTLSQRGQDTL